MLVIRSRNILKPILLLPFFILVIVGFTVPSDGAHGLLSIKSLSFISTVFCTFFLILLTQRFHLAQFKVISFLICSFAFLLSWLMLSIIYGETPTNSAFDQFKMVWLTISVVAISVYLVSEKLISFQTLLKVIIYANCFYSTIKVIAVIMHCLGLINMWALVDRLGIRFMSMNIVGILPRFQTSIDIASPFLLYFFFQAKKIGIEWSLRFKVWYLFFSTIAIFLSFSRFLMFIGVLSWVLHVLTERAPTIVKAALCALILMMAGVAIVGVDTVYKVIERRLFSSDNYASDYARSQQIEALLEEYDQFPIMGKGLGGFAKKLVRDGQILHSYEVQWVALLMQFGWIGLILLLYPLWIIAANILSQPWTRSKIGLFILFSGWLFSGFTNPFLISLTSGILYALFLLMGREFSKEEEYV